MDNVASALEERPVTSIVKDVRCMDVPLDHMGGCRTCRPQAWAQLMVLSKHLEGKIQTR
ncbi:uncharacterized protein LAESUDRAFT_721182 [Laetiporus sulphureus 93-53]|uniref:Uncharacterized protein n=1 Tax=Laetiporus sulphureus 93-53 TaxID=1314785 RepID=A0A165GTM7_9APHY|nr:uncharacterized protein LAESUDRAFT_721182 [Laetiporus sulphureus 93-53]KZT10797.1 hypothetical protein LAESUDRAFT_721182 [Laetiporus sulphureus 93-53]